MDRSEGLRMHLYVGTSSGIARSPSRGVILVAQAPAAQERAASQPQQRRVPFSLRCRPVQRVKSGTRACRHLVCVSLIPRIAECSRIPNPIFALGVDLRRPSRGRSGESGPLQCRALPTRGAAQPGGPESRTWATAGG